VLQEPTAGTSALRESDLSMGRRLLDRDALLRKLEGAAGRRVTVISAPAGSGKAFALARTGRPRGRPSSRPVRVPSNATNTTRRGFWRSVLYTIRRPAPPIDPALDGDRLVSAIVSKLDEQVAPVALDIDDLHELRSAGGVTQLGAAARGAAGKCAHGALVSARPADPAALAQARRRPRRAAGRGSAVRRARDVRAAGHSRHGDPAAQARR
jgi:hypothetical protein